MRKITITVDDGSLSARRAWIEIYHPHFHVVFVVVALRKESVDRNTFRQVCIVTGRVALRKESVDRNFVSAFDVLAISGRSPQGERG